MVGGTQWPGGDPFLQRQNEPSMAVSSRNSQHRLAGANDYRTVDLPGLGINDPTGDAWLGVFKSYDGGKTWTSSLLPGYPQDTSPAGTGSVIKPFGAAADPYVRAGTNGMFYYGGLAFNRETGGANSIFVARFNDANNIEGGDTIQYVGNSIIARGDSTHFLDKPSIAVDIPRPGVATCVIPSVSGAQPQSFLGGRIYVTYTVFLGTDISTQSAIMLAQSNDCGITWSTPVKVSGSQMTNQGSALAIDPKTGNVYVVWRVFASKKDPNSIMGIGLDHTTGLLTPPVQVATINPFDQGTTGYAFRTNAYPTIAVDGSGGVYVAWAQRGAGPGGDARIMILSGKQSYSGTQFTGFQVGGPSVVNAYSGRGHQFMPAMAFSSGKLTLAWYDLRDDDQIAYYTPLGGGLYSFALQPDGTPVFDSFIQDPAPAYQPTSRRHTMDVWAAQARPQVNPTFGSAVMVSQYAFGTPASSPTNVIQQLEMNPPNVPLFQGGSAPFIGDYIDVAGPTFIPTGSSWRFNTEATDSDNASVVWTDNRNVVQPADGNWTHYTPVAIGSGQNSLFDPTTKAPACIAGQTGMRNQDIYTAALTPGVVMSALGNAKQLSPTVQRAFAITVQNTSATQTKSFRLSITAQPTGGVASFLQFAVTGPLTQLDVQIPPSSSASRSVFVTSSDPNGVVTLNAIEINQPNGTILPTGLTSAVVLNSDVSNPNISNPNISNTEIYNPNISNPNISNPNISNPNISNPNISNPNISNTTIANPNISNPNISNPNISNPNISNPNISNPNISNPNISNASLTDASYTVTNSGNTSSAYTLQLLQNQPVPPGVTVQLIVSNVYTTPVAVGCSLSVEAHYLPVLNITNPTFATVGSLSNTGPVDPNAPTFSLAPGGTALVTLRVYDSTTNNPALALAHYNPATALSPVVVSNAANTGTTTPVSTFISIIAAAMQNAVLGSDYLFFFKAAGGVQPYTWSLVNGTLPAGLKLNPDGSVTGVPAGAGDFKFTAKVVDVNGANGLIAQTLHVEYPAATQNFSYTFPLILPGVSGPYTWSADATTLPPGMAIIADGTLSGKPTTTGYYAFSAIAQDVTGIRQTVPVTLQVVNFPVIVSNVNLNGNGAAAAVTGGSTLTLTFDYRIFEDPSCPNCRDQIQVGFAGGQPQTCAYDGVPGVAPGVSGSASTRLTAPASPGTYYLGISRSEQYSCLATWAGRIPTSTFYIGTVTVSAIPQ